MFANRLTFLIVFFLISSHAFAIDLSITDSERRALPPNCAVNHPMYQTHYCNGLNFLNRHYRERVKSGDTFNLGQAIGELSYVVSYFSQDSPFMADTYLNRGTAYSLMSKWGNAIEDWNMAIKLNPKTVMAYVSLADYYAKLKMDKRALEIIITGLKRNPDAKALKRKYDKLGGQQPYPEPIEPVDSAAKVNAATKASDTTAAQDEPGKAVAATAPDISPTAVPSNSISSSKNPWCRFCPDTQQNPPHPSPSTPVTNPKVEQ
jgi:tetratricopeptide (TPR) repeat protein